MIKINLLLARKEKKKIGIKKEFIVAGASVLALVLCLGVLHWRMGLEREEVRLKITQARDKIAKNKSLTQELNKAKEAQKTYQEKLGVINALRREKASPAKVLDEISIQKPEKMQLEGLKKDGARLSMEGIAMDDETVAHFMTNLRKSRLFKNVDLIVTEQSEVSKVKLKKFNLSCEISPM